MGLGIPSGGIEQGMARQLLLEPEVAPYKGYVEREAPNTKIQAVTEKTSGVDESIAAFADYSRSLCHLENTTTDEVEAFVRSCLKHGGTILRRPEGSGTPGPWWQMFDRVSRNFLVSGTSPNEDHNIQ
jgi:hypothetical protein